MNSPVKRALSWESWLIRSPDTRKIASSNLAESILPPTAENFFFAKGIAQKFSLDETLRIC